MNAHNDTAAAVSPQPPEAVISHLAFGALMTQALAVVAKLGIADLLAERPQPASQLAAATTTDEQSLYRVLRSVASVGIFRETEPAVFANTPLSELLRSDAPNSMRNVAIFMGEEWHWRVWGNMMHSVRTGKPAWGHVHGAEVFDYSTKNPEHAEIFNDAMTDMSVGAAGAIVGAYDFSGINVVCDIAGGHGYLLSQVLKTNPTARGILFDMPNVIAGAGELIEREGASERIKKVAGDFFSSVPAGADAYMMKHIIHDWDDERCITILRNIHTAMRADGKLLIIEVVVPEGNEPHYSKLLDLEMLVSPGGRERTADEYRTLLHAADLRLTRIVETKSPLSIIEAIKAQH